MSCDPNLEKNKYELAEVGNKKIIRAFLTFFEIFRLLWLKRLGIQQSLIQRAFTADCVFLLSKFIHPPNAKHTKYVKKSIVKRNHPVKIFVPL